VLLTEDRFDEMDRVCADGERRCTTTGSVNVLPFYHGARALRLLAAGALGDAAANAEIMLDLLSDVQGDWAAHAHGLLARVALHRGDVAGARHQIDLGAATIRGPGYGLDCFHWTSALTLEAEGDPDAARRLLFETWDQFAPFRLYPTLSPAAIDVLRMALGAGDRERIAEVAAVLEVGAAGSSAASVHGTAQLAKGLATGDLELVRQAVATCAGGPRSLTAAQVAELAADVVGGGEAITHLRHAASAYEAAGAAHDVARVAAALRQRGTRLGARGRRQRPGVGWDSLTPSELHVSELAAEGMTTRAVADRLFVSVNTVETHLRHIYRKLEIRSRAELATLVGRRREG